MAGRRRQHTGRRPRTAAEAARPDDASVCPYFHEAVELVGKRWTGAIVDALLPAPMRFSEIAHAIPQISDRLLSMRLRELEAAASSRAQSTTARRCASSTR